MKAVSYTHLDVYKRQDFLACNAPIQKLFDLGIEIEENSELDLLVSVQKHKDDPRIPEVVADMEKELAGNNPWKDLIPKLAQFELTPVSYTHLDVYKRQLQRFWSVPTKKF